MADCSHPDIYSQRWTISRTAVRQGCSMTLCHQAVTLCTGLARVLPRETVGPSHWGCTL